MTQSSPDTTSFDSFIGLDLGDRKSAFCQLGRSGSRPRQEGAVETSREAMTAFFKRLPASVVLLETGTHSPWVSRLIAKAGHTVIVAASRQLALITKSLAKSDRKDARMLARIARHHLELVKGVHHRPEEMQVHLTTVNARFALVGARTRLINTVRGCVKPLGYRVPRCSAESFHHRAVKHVPPSLIPALMALLRQIEWMTKQIKAYDKQIEELCTTKYPITRHLQRVYGVGPQTALLFVLVLVDPTRFRRSRDVGAYVGLVPRSRSSGDSKPELPITKAGNGDLRRMLVIAANTMTKKSAPDTDLKRYAERLARDGGKNAKKRAKVAAARRLAVMLHHLWLTGVEYDPLYRAHLAEARPAA